MRNKGQIKRGSNLGEAIYKLAKTSKYIVEIGTWRGMGSTKCIIDGIKESKNFTEGFSIECNINRLNEARRNLGDIPEHFNLIEGTITDPIELTEIKNDLEGQKLKWIEEDIKWMNQVPNVFKKLPKNIDLCIIDGGEFSGYIEFQKLWPRCNYMVLDDSNCFKHSKSREYILKHPEIFNVIKDVEDERNGYVICKNKQYV